jgi:ribulose-bisphosphate carboxylase small chain
MKTETFSYLPAFSGEQVEKQIAYFLDGKCVIGIEYSSKPGPALAFWDWWKLPLFNMRSVSEVMAEIEACKSAHPQSYIRVTGYDNVRQAQVMSFVVYQPA